jgi:hypothetical protein
MNCRCRRRIGIWLSTPTPLPLPPGPIGVRYAPRSSPQLANPRQCLRKSTRQTCPGRGSSSPRHSTAQGQRCKSRVLVSTGTPLVAQVQADVGAPGSADTSQAAASPQCRNVSCVQLRCLFRALTMFSPSKFRDSGPARHVGRRSCLSLVLLCTLRMSLHRKSSKPTPGIRGGAPTPRQVSTQCYMQPKRRHSLVCSHWHLLACAWERDASVAFHTIAGALHHVTHRAPIWQIVCVPHFPTCWQRCHS